MPSDPWTNEHLLYNLNNLQAAIQQEHPNWLALETLALAVRLRKELHRLNRSWLRSQAKWRHRVILHEGHRYRPNQSFLSHKAAGPSGARTW